MEIPDTRAGAPLAGSLDVTNQQVVDFVRLAYGLMAFGLLVTATTAAVVVSSRVILLAIVRSQPLFWGLLIAQLGIVLVLSGRVHKLAASTAAFLFIGYSALTGVTLSILALVYTGESLASTFVIAAAMFGAMAAYGTMTKRDLQGWRQFLFMGLIGVVIATVVNIFLQQDAVGFVTAFIGVIVFTGLAAYDAQRLRVLAVATSSGQTTGQSGSYAVVGALALYLDFVNLFLMLLRLLGGRRR